jgi:ESS family glutamate:Na+ symporter
VQTIALSELHTVMAALLALAVGHAVCRRVGFLQRLNVPAPVVGGVLASLAIAALRAWGGTEVTFGTALRDLLLLMFFTTVGLSARFSTLKAGGKPLVFLCAVTVLLLLAQNVVGIAVAMVYGANPFYGLLIGSISFVGGPGTALAWAKEGEAMGLAHAPEVALGAATLAVVFGALVSGPITGWFIERRGLHAAARAGAVPWEPSEDAAPVAAAPPVEDVMRGVLLILIAIAIGDWLNQWARGASLVLPGFLTAMLGGVLITNAADAFRRPLDFAPIERSGEVALQIFLALSLMSMQLWTVANVITPLMINVVLQIVVTALVAFLVLFPALGRDYNAAVACGGFLGFGLSSMPVAMATMDQITSRYGAAPRAFLLVTLAGSFFVDLANAFVTKGFLALPLFR